MSARLTCLLPLPGPLSLPALRGRRAALVGGRIQRVLRGSDWTHCAQLRPGEHPQGLLLECPTPGPRVITMVILWQPFPPFVPSAGG